jgi:hypothetical protein
MKRMSLTNEVCERRYALADSGTEKPVLQIAVHPITVSTTLPATSVNRSSRPLCRYISFS